MRIVNYTQKTLSDEAGFPDRRLKDEELFILCRTHEITALRDIFDFDESTVLDCSDLDESVRYTSFDDYDFISMVHIEISPRDFLSREINLYVSSRYLILVTPDHDSPRLFAMEKKLLDSARLIWEKPDRINRLYYLVLHTLLADFSDMLETLEDLMQELSEEILSKVEKAQFVRISELSRISYAIKKQLRALSYLGEQILLDENKFISENQLHQFRSIDTRLKKLYDFSESLYHLAREMLYTYDSRVTMKTNDTVNKLTAITLFFGPLTVITGIYGMNFDMMPELRWPLGYPFALLMMAAASGIMFFVFKKKKWM